MPKLIISTQTNPYINIAVENYLLSQPSDGDVTMYLWQNSRTVVIGQNQNPYAECNVAQLEQDGGYLMRRRTGGGAVFHDLGNLNFSFVVPYEMYDTMRQFSVLRRAVETYGLDTAVSGRNDVLCQGRKFSGNAFAKGKYQRLHHGTILIRTDVERSDDYLLPLHRFEYILISLKLMLFRREIRIFKIQELRSEQTYTTAVILVNERNILRTADITEHIDLGSVNSNVLLADQFLKSALLLEILIALLRKSRHSLLIRINEHFARVAVDADLLSVGNSLEELLTEPDNSGDIHISSENSRM